MKIGKDLDYSAYLYTCNKCRSCIHPEEVPSEIMCPSFYEREFITFSGAGRLYTAQGILENKISQSLDATQEIAYQCMLCYACARNCPAGLPLPEVLYDLRETVFEENPPFYALNLKKKIEKYLNPWGKLTPITSKGEIPLFVGCSYSFLYPDTVKKFLTQLEREGKTVECINGTCCGAPLLEIGDINGFKKMAEEVIKKVENKSTLYVMDPHCLWALKKFCENEGIFIEILPAFLLVESPPEKGEGELLYHDSCKLGRFCGYYEEPRALIEKTGFKIKEFVLHKKISLCCGGNWGAKPEIKRATTRRKLKVIKKENLPVVVSCPLCRNTLKGVEVVDIYELISEV